MLLDKGSNINLQDGEGQTALHYGKYNFSLFLIIYLQKSITQEVNIKVLGL